MVVYVCFLVLFGLLCYLARQFPTLPGDIAISLWLQGVDLPFLNPTMKAISYISSLIPAAIIVVLVAVGLWGAGKKLDSIFIVSLTSLAALLDWLLKSLISRPRPDGLIQTLLGNNDYSFPSGHIAYAVVFYGFLFYLLPGLNNRPAIIWILRSGLVLLILLTGASRVYLGAHWPSDALGGIFLGGLLLALAIVLYNYLKRPRTKAVPKNA
ncbi:MAG: phosphatase PAP2 family protein [Chloroflexota bacterium]